MPFVTAESKTREALILLPHKGISALRHAQPPRSRRHRRGEAGDRAADRAPGPRRQPRPRHHERAGRAVPDLAARRGVDRPATTDARRRGRPPPPRGHRAGHRRPEELDHSPTCHPATSWRTPRGVVPAVSRSTCSAPPAPASRFHATATTSTLQTQPISIPARTTTSARRIRLRLPANWPGNTPGRRSSPTRSPHPPPADPTSTTAPLTGDQPGSREDRPNYGRTSQQPSRSTSVPPKQSVDPG